MKEEKVIGIMYKKLGSQIPPSPYQLGDLIRTTLD